MKKIECMRDGLPCDLNRGSHSCRNGPWAGKCFDRIERDNKPSRRAKAEETIEVADNFAPEEAETMAALEAEELARYQAEQDAQAEFEASFGPEGGDP